VKMMARFMVLSFIARTCVVALEPGSPEPN